MGEDIGIIEDVVLDKRSSSIMFAVVGVAGFLAINEKYHPPALSSLNYDRRQGSYVMPYSKEPPREAPVGLIDDPTGDRGVIFRKPTYEYCCAPVSGPAAER